MIAVVVDVDQVESTPLLRAIDAALARYPALCRFGARVRDRSGNTGPITALYVDASTIPAGSVDDDDDRRGEVWARVTCPGGPVYRPLSLLSPVETS